MAYSGHDTSRKMQVENEKKDKEAGREKGADVPRRIMTPL